ncbi:MAG TPA: thioesterase [Candidatus Latescibacteria bacterium]|nr:thioesterase [Candidatus Latescibacterota bacterium]
MARVSVDLPDRFPFETKLSIRIGDINYGGHLGNDTVLTLVHECRVQFLSHLGFSEVDVGGVGIIQVDAAVVYTSEAFYGETARVQVAAALEGRSSFDLLYRLSEPESDREIARVKTGIAFYNYESRKIARIPGDFRDAIAGLD